MDDAIILSDEEPCGSSFLRENECIIIEESRLSGNEISESCNTHFSLTEAILKRESIGKEYKSSIDSEIDELDKLIESRRKENLDNRITLNLENIINSDNLKKPEKRKLTTEHKENMELVKKVREEKNLLKNAEKEKKKDEMRKKRIEKEKEKETRKIEREISTALNSKCELYTYCHIGKSILDQLPGLEDEIRLLYSERKIDNQFVIEKELGTRIEWRRKCIELREDENGRCERFEYSSTQNLFAIVVSSETLADVINSNSLQDFIVEQRSNFRIGKSTMLIVCYGKLNIVKKKFHNLSIDIYENYRAQIVQVEKLSELALLTAQYLRSLARREKKRVECERQDSSGSGGHKVQYLGDKGISVGSRSEMVADWWNKMLSTIDRLSDAQRRALMKLIPDPIAGIEKYGKMDYSNAITEIGDVITENDRRIGPVMAHRIYTILTDMTGNSFVE